MLNNSRIITRLSLGFSLLLLGTLLLGAIGARNVIQLGDVTADIFRHPFAVATSIRDVRSESLMAQNILGSIARGASPAEAGQLHRQLLAQSTESDAHLAVVRERFLGNREDVEQIDRSLAMWRKTRDEIVALVHQGRRAAAVALYEERAAPLAAAVLEEIEVVADFAADKAASFERTANRTRHETLQRIVGTLILIMAAGIVLAVLITRAITRPLAELRTRMTRLAEGDLGVEVPYRDVDNELGAMAGAVQVLKEAAVRLEGRRWVKANTSELATALQTAADARDFAGIVVGKLVPLLAGGAGAFYCRDPARDTFELLGSWGLKPCPRRPTSYRPGESLVGQCALERKCIVLGRVPDDYLRIASGTGEAAARSILVAPVMSQDAVLAVLEIAAFQEFSVDQQALIDEALPIIALTLEILQASEHTRALLEQTQQQAEELRASEEELRAQTEEIQASNEELRASEEELKTQQEELRTTNEELAEKTRVLEEARGEADRRALELGTASRYKSEFLANMSHELRTPLNSLLILAHSLAENAEGNLQPDQVESAKVIAESGTSLLRLINDILDLSKVEAGKMAVHAVEIAPVELGASLLRRFQRLADAKGLALALAVGADLPATIAADRGKVDQILNNLVGNALKFTEQGGVTVHMERRRQQLAIEIADTGIGIPGEKIEAIFQAFEQVDGSASRRYGGTGLGLTISRKLARLMGGDVAVSSTEGEGSRFLLLLPIGAPAGDAAASEASTQPPAPAPSAPSATPADDRDLLAPDDEVILIVDDDASFARIVRDLAHKNGFKCLTAGNGKAGLDLARHYRPTGIILDLGLPDMDGWTVMDRLKTYPETCDIPVQFMSATDAAPRGLEMGAVGYFTKPVAKEQIVGAFERIQRGARAPDLQLDDVTLFLHGVQARLPEAQQRRMRSLQERGDAAEGPLVLVVDDDMRNTFALSKVLRTKGMRVVMAQNGRTALDQLETIDGIDVVLMDIMMPGMDGYQTIREIRRRERFGGLPVIALTAQAMLGDREKCLAAGADDYVSKPVDIEALLAAIRRHVLRPPA